MSLLNEVLRDLQARGAGEADPLAGLHPVAATRTSARRFVPLIGLGAAIAIALTWTLLRPEAHAVSAVSPPAAVPAELHDPPEAIAEVQPLPLPAATEPVTPITPIDVAALPQARVTRAAAPAPSDPVKAAPAPQAVAAEEPVERTALPADTAAPLISRRVAAQPGAAVETTVSRGLQAMRARNLLAAARFFEDALRTDPGHGEAWQYLYAARAAARQDEAAVQALQRGLTAARTPAPLAKLYAQRLLERGNTAAAIGVLQRYRPAPAGDTEYDTLLAGLLLGEGQFAAAGAIYRQLIDHDETTGAWWIGLAMSRDSLGDTSAALAAYERALRADGLEPPLANYAQRRIAELRTHG